MSEPKKNGKLEWNPETDLGLESVNLTCEKRTDTVETSIIEKLTSSNESEFFEIERTITKFSKCKPTVKENKTIDTKNRITTDQLTTISTKTKRKLDPNDRGLETETRLGLMSARVNTLTRLIRESPNESDKAKYQNIQNQLTQQIEQLTKEKDASSKLYQ